MRFCRLLCGLAFLVWWPSATQGAEASARQPNILVLLADDLGYADWKLVKPDLATDAQFGNIAKQPMLFNLATDIGEKTDLAAQHPQKVKELLTTWQKWNAGLVRPAWAHHSLQRPPKK